MAIYLRGALIAFTPTALVPLPNIIVFQYNPETMTHTWSQQPVAPTAGAVRGDPLAVTGLPGETFAFTVAMDAADSIADGKKVSGALAKVSGVATRLAALEMLIRPAATKGGTLLGTVTAGIAGIGKEKKDPQSDVPANRLPVVLFVWGPGRVVPVRLTTLTITERLYDPLLNPTHAEAQLGLQVLTAADVTGLGGGPLATVAKAADIYTDSLREVLALANLANATESVIGMLPL